MNVSRVTTLPDVRYYQGSYVVRSSEEGIRSGYDAEQDDTGGPRVHGGGLKRPIIQSACNESNKGTRNYQLTKGLVGYATEHRRD